MNPLPWGMILSFVVRMHVNFHSCGFVITGSASFRPRRLAQREKVAGFDLGAFGMVAPVRILVKSKEQKV